MYYSIPCRQRCNHLTVSNISGAALSFIMSVQRGLQVLTPRDVQLADRLAGGQLSHLNVPMRAADYSGGNCSSDIHSASWPAARTCRRSLWCTTTSIRRPELSVDCRCFETLGDLTSAGRSVLQEHVHRHTSKLHKQRPHILVHLICRPVSMNLPNLAPRSIVLNDGHCRLQEHLHGDDSWHQHRHSCGPRGHMKLDVCTRLF